MSDTATSPMLGGSVAWLAAYALGLAYSGSSDEQRLADLIDTTRGDTQLLEAAHRRLDGAEVAERAICEAALHLLARARGGDAAPNESNDLDLGPATCPGDLTVGHRTTIALKKTL
jgi:hypothetical protein